jgi:hypothetical protein
LSSLLPDLVNLLRDVAHLQQDLRGLPPKWVKLPYDGKVCNVVCVSKLAVAVHSAWDLARVAM